MKRIILSLGLFFLFPVHGLRAGSYDRPNRYLGYRFMSHYSESRATVSFRLPSGVKIRRRARIKIWTTNFGSQDYVKTRVYFRR